MYIRIQFDDVEREETRNTLQLFFGVPNGTCLSSLGSKLLSVEGNHAYWYIETETENKNVKNNSINHLRDYSGVVSVDVIPYEELPPTCRTRQDTCDTPMKGT